MNQRRSLNSYFEELIASGHLAHGYLLFGGASVETRARLRSFVLALGHFLERDSWKLTKQPLSDFLIVERQEKASIGIEAARAVKQFLYQKPNVSRYRLVAVFDAHLLTPEAQNALLKVVEEPPEAGVLFFVTNHEDDVVPALASRLQKLSIQSFSLEGFNGVATKKRSARSRILSFDVKSDDDVNRVFEALIGDLGKDAVRNVNKLRAVFSRLVPMKRYSTNRKLQMRALEKRLKN